ncbi:Uncharacterised protein [Legionella beliardensis]|uniref:Uncharacterized protein n=1 Tax=Legionella beliardensis TaxID=91822 RepID=A0A378I1I1_9GAMM|nr:Uncharacterised protein [Legionella beliardensis]
MQNSMQFKRAYFLLLSNFVNYSVCPTWTYTAKLKPTASSKKNPLLP